MQSIDAIVEMSPAEAEVAVRGALAEQGFGVLTEIDVAAVLWAKLSVKRPFLRSSAPVTQRSPSGRCRSTPR